jgi:hypothetical protein
MRTNTLLRVVGAMPVLIYLLALPFIDIEYTTRLIVIGTIILISITSLYFQYKVNEKNRLRKYLLLSIGLTATILIFIYQL